MKKNNAKALKTKLKKIFKGINNCQKTKTHFYVK